MFCLFKRAFFHITWSKKAMRSEITLTSYHLPYCDVCEVHSGTSSNTSNNLSIAMLYYNSRQEDDLNPVPVN